jgi:hypothetical protein
MVKKSLAEKKPVVIGMNCPPSFFKAKGVWRPGPPAGISGGHALSVVGYDDDKYGGAFEVENSWGKGWGNAGFMWIPYDVFGEYAFEAYGLTENMANYRAQAAFEGSVQIQMRDGGRMAVRKRGGFYESVDSFPSGTRFRYLLDNKKSAYVYAFAADNTASPPVQVFPQPGVSALLDYSDNTVPLPGEFKWLQMDNKAGVDYLVVLYSKHSLDMNAVLARFAASSGTFAERTAAAAGPAYIRPENVDYTNGHMAFSASSTNPNAVFVLALAIRH